MARGRLQLHEMLMSVAGLAKVYAQPPQNTAMKYPCIIYERSDSLTHAADDVDYLRYKKWTVTVIDRDIDSLIPDRVESLEFSVFDRYFVVDGLHHNVFQIHF